MADFTQCSLILECTKCQILNYLDPFTFWFFDGKVKCAGCNAVWALKIDNGQRVAGPTEAQGPHDKLPGYAQSKDYKTKITESGKVNPPVMARADFVGRPIPIYKSIRGKPVSGGPLKPEDLVGSRPRFILEGRHFK
ncbi:MAG TPA: hypothetical protein VLH58_02095 [Candidatus Methylomirabilis sp.]|nr:hypothetical protein [Candidatus Methylomirabilis sp.]HSC70114.1 hypothetical protein [Candidatus Methylomirabilis sp.]